MGSPADIGIFTTDASLVVTSWDDWMAAATRVPRERALGASVAELLPDLQPRGFLGRLQHVIESGVVEVLSPALHHYLVACEPRTQSKRFAQMQQRVTIGPLLDAGRITGAIVTIEDVTARLEAERDLAEQASRADLESDDWRVRQAAVQRLASDADRSFVEALVASLRERHRDFNLLSSVLKLLGSSNVDATGMLVDLLREPDADLRIQAALALGDQHDPAAIPALREALADPEVNVQFQIIESLGRLRADGALDDLLGIVESNDFFLAFAALDAVAAINDPRAAARLVPLLESETLRVPVAETLGTLGDERAVSPLVRALDGAAAGAASIAAALIRIHDRFEREFQDGARIVDRVREHATVASQRSLVQAVSVAGRNELGPLVRVLGWLDGDDVVSALTRLLGDAGVRDDVIEALVRHGDRVVERLIEQLRSPDRDIRHAAIVALGRVGSRRATPALVSALNAEDDLLIAVAGALARIGDQAAFEPLLALLGHADSAVRQSAVGALNSIGHPDLPSRIGRLLADPNPLVRESAVKIAGYFGYAETVEALFARASDSDEAVRRAALEHLPFVDDVRVLPTLVAALERDGARVRASAARALGRVEDPDATDALMEALGDADPWVRYFAIRGLIEQQCAPAAVSLIGLAERDPAAHVRIAALDALGAFGSSQAAPVLKRLAADDQHEIAAAALSALGRVADAEGLQPLRDAIRSESPPRRLAAIAALAANGSADAVASLEWAAAADPDPAVSGAAVEALGKVAAANVPGAAAAIDALLLLLSDRDRRERSHDAIARLPVSRVGDLSRGLQHPRADVRSATVSVLGRFHCEEATRALSSALTDAAPAVREAAVQTLARLGARGVEQALATLSANDPSKAVRRAAAAALTELGR